MAPACIGSDWLVIDSDAKVTSGYTLPRKVGGKRVKAPRAKKPEDEKFVGVTLDGEDIFCDDEIPPVPEPVPEKENHGDEEFKRGKHPVKESPWANMRGGCGKQAKNFGGRGSPQGSHIMQPKPRGLR